MEGCLETPTRNSQDSGRKTETTAQSKPRNASISPSWILDEYPTKAPLASLVEAFDQAKSEAESRENSKQQAKQSKAKRNPP